MNQSGVRISQSDSVGVTLGQRIRRLREIIGLSQIDLVERLEDYGVVVSQAYMSRVERNERMPGADVIAGLARVLGVTTDHILDMRQDGQVGGTPGDSIWSVEGRRTAFLVDNLPPSKRRFAMGLVEYVVKYRDEPQETQVDQT